jgi:hypothetical protein
MNIYTFDNLPTPRPISVLWATKALLAFPYIALLLLSAGASNLFAADPYKIPPNPKSLIVKDDLICNGVVKAYMYGDYDVYAWIWVDNQHEWFYFQFDTEENVDEGTAIRIHRVAASYKPKPNEICFTHRAYRTTGENTL